ncbi:hypothetical protein FGO68_gene12357 [Halteria grandinella]|uniref:Squalene synthase n=1 Tax=Halteria grandinella TaxID=5974 RepID=A0A8J8NT11_HALGN|nr:hypothetical protein FGO68_gene12357 [Halteria grandinella]
MNEELHSSANSAGTTSADEATEPCKSVLQKQGAYGKVPIHKHSKFGQLARISEVYALAKFVAKGQVADNMQNQIPYKDDDIKFCDDILGKVSRSFAAVIRQLPEGLCVEILVFYLVLRGLDTIEDDMEAFVGREKFKLDHLRNFYKTPFSQEGWSMDGVGQGDEKVLLQNFFKVVRVFKGLSLESQEIISDITQRMGEGMALFAGRNLTQGTHDIKDYNLYCHYVAGLVGEGLSRLFSSSSFESPEVTQSAKTLGNTMGLFLQKTNITRDYLEDLRDGRTFYPQEIWKRYSKTGDLSEFAESKYQENALQCLNHMVTDALGCVPECLKYMELLKNKQVFRFCAIPQVMAIATLADLYNNPKVFTGVVKIRKGLAVKLLNETQSEEALHKQFNHFARQILSSIPQGDQNSSKTKEICENIISLTNLKANLYGNSTEVQLLLSGTPIAIALAANWIGVFYASLLMVAFVLFIRMASLI